MTDRPTPEDEFNELLEAAAAHRDEVKIDTFVRARTAEAVHDYHDPHADIRARFSSHRVDEAGLDAMDIVRNASFARGEDPQARGTRSCARGRRILDDLQQIMFAANHEIARAHSLGLVGREKK